MKRDKKKYKLVNKILNLKSKIKHYKKQSKI